VSEFGFQQGVHMVQWGPKEFEIFQVIDLHLNRLRKFTTFDASCSSAGYRF
jgi:hypothetical protein